MFVQGNVKDEYIKHAFKIFQLKEIDLPTVTILKVGEDEVLKKYKISNQKLSKDVIYSFLDDFLKGNSKINLKEISKYIFHLKKFLRILTTPT